MLPTSPAFAAGSRPAAAARRPLLARQNPSSETQRRAGSGPAPGCDAVAHGDEVNGFLARRGLLFKVVCCRAARSRLCLGLASSL
jgi:hypothetical protein